MTTPDAPVPDLTEAMVDAALHATVPGGSEVWVWLPQKDAFTPSETARDVIRVAVQAAARVIHTALAEPVDMLLFCPNCGVQHIDEPGGEWAGEAWTNPPHKSHLCLACGCIWRPADRPTNGVAALKTTGKADTWKLGDATALAERDAKLAEVRADVLIWKSKCQMEADERRRTIAEQAAVIERLREALGQIASGEVFREMRFAEDDETDYFMRRERKGQLFARAALGDRHE